MVIDTSAIIAVLAKARRLPLLFQGDDFSQTDIAGVSPQTPPEAATV